MLVLQLLLSKSQTLLTASNTLCALQWLKWFCEAGGGSPDEARLEQTPYPFQPTNLALFRHKMTLYRFNQGGSYTIAGGAQMGAGGLSPLALSL